MEDLSKTPDSVSVPKVPKTLAHRLFNSPADSTIAHFNRLLATSYGVDRTLMVASYGLVLVHSQLYRLLNLQLRVLAERLATNAAKSIRPGETIITTMPMTPITTRLAGMHASAKGLQAIISDLRIFLRLWGLLGVWSWARNTYYNGPKDALLRTVAWGQIAVNTGYYVYEHAAYLAMKNLVRGVSEEKQNKWWLISGRLFAGHVMLDFIRLWRVRQLRDAEGGIGEKEDKIERQKSESLWWKEFFINCAWAPLVVHWSRAKGFVNDDVYGLLGIFCASMGFREIWRQTA